MREAAEAVDPVDPVEGAAGPLGVTPSQTVGPYFSIGLTWADGVNAVEPGTPGALWIRGRLTDGNGHPVPDAVVETWQADPDGRFDHALATNGSGRVRAQAGKGRWEDAFRGLGRSPTDEDGRYSILTLKPGAVAGPDGRPQAPHVDVSVFARGLLKRVVTRIYFDDEPDANAADALLERITDPRERSTLIARRSDDGYAFDIRLQGDDETVFFEV
jgi:protocatechuate 3,4-dioxygenase, alpha subunit